MMPKLSVERLGGLAGFGSSRSHLQSTGELDVDDLSEVDRQAVEALLRAPTKKAASSSARRRTPAPHVADGFRYTLALEGRPAVTVQEADVPDAVRQCVQDRLT